MTLNEIGACGKKSSQKLRKTLFDSKHFCNHSFYRNFLNIHAFSEQPVMASPVYMVQVRAGVFEDAIACFAEEPALLGFGGEIRHQFSFANFLIDSDVFRSVFQ